MKFDIEDIQSLFSDLEAENIFSATQTNKAMDRLEKLAQEIKKEKEAEPKVKKDKAQYVIVTSSEQFAENNLQDVSFWIMKIPANKDHNSIAFDLQKAAVNFNENDRKAKKHKIEVLPDALLSLKKKHFLGVVQPEANIPKIIAKEPVICIGVPQEIVTDE